MQNNRNTRQRWICSLYTLLLFVFSGTALSACFSKASNPYKTFVSQQSCDQRFSGRSGGKVRWQGADNAQSVLLPNGRLLWMYSDSFVGEEKDGRRHNAHMINNTIGIQDKADCTAPVRFYWKRRSSTQKKPKAFFLPSSGRGFFWPGSGVMAGKTLLAIMLWREKNPTPKDVFDGASPLGSRLLAIKNPTASPDQWTWKELALPSTPGHKLALGLGVWPSRTVPGWFFVLGSQEKGAGITDITLHRFRWNKSKTNIEQFQTYHGQKGWKAGLQTDGTVLFQGASQTSVMWDEARKQYLAFYGRGWGGLYLRTSKTLTQGWSKEVLFYRFPEWSRHSSIFCGTAALHPALPGAQEPWVTNVCNSTDFWKVAPDLSLYIPITGRLRWTDALKKKLK